MDPSGIIDAHQHFWRYRPERDLWITEEYSPLKRDFMPGDLLTELRDHGIRGTVLVQATQSEEENSFLIGLAERNPFILGIVGWVDLKAPGLGRRLDFFRRFCPKVRGFRHLVQDEPDPDFLSDPRFCAGISALKDYGFTFDLLVRPHQLASTLKFLEKFPDQPMVIDHLAKPPVRTGNREPWGGYMKEFAGFPSVCCKVSGLVTEGVWHQGKLPDFSPYLDIVTEAFGTRRLIFGSDWPVCLLAAGYGQALSLIRGYFRESPLQELNGILASNAERFYNLGTSQASIT